MTDSIYNERVCPICHKFIWKWDKECSNCNPKKETKMNKLKEAIRNSVTEIENMSDAEFQSLLKKHENGDVANALIDAEALKDKYKRFSKSVRDSLFLCPRCNNYGFSSVYVLISPEGRSDLCTTCANKLRFFNGNSTINEETCEIYLRKTPGIDIFKKHPLSTGCEPPEDI